MNYLALNAPHASRVTMRYRIVSFLVLLAVFFGTTAVPVLAHASGDGFVHASEMIDVHEVEAPVAHSDLKKQSDTKESGGSPSVDFNHHCTCATKTDDFAPKIAAFFSAQIFSRTLAAVMPSRRSAPLTEPPSA